MCNAHLPHTSKQQHAGKLGMGRVSTNCNWTSAGMPPTIVVIGCHAVQISGVSAKLHREADYGLSSQLCA